MAEHRGVWGIDIGQAGLKAIRLRYAEAAGQAIAVAFDYVPHPKILSQPDAIPEELIPQALQTFLSRNDVAGDVLCISVPGQSALARFIQLPPVESSKVAEIVKYEARQQIPFALEDVIWDYQTLGGGTEESGFMLEAEVGLFAMKRDQVLQHLRPFNDAKVEVDQIQIAPLALYNFLSYDQLGIRADNDEGGGDENTIVLDMGADNTTLLVSNGEKIWIRNVPVGGNHFTRALTKEMKLTFAKAEHLKCNATKSEDPRAVFQALRPVFNDYVSEIQRSIGYFSSVNRDAKIVKVLGLGNGFRLAGLQKFLQQNLQYPVDRVENFSAVVGDGVLNAPLFEENIMSFGVAYGLALQGLGLTRVHTSLLPPEIATARKIRQKKPWAVATAATLLLGLSLSAIGYANVWKSVSVEKFGESEQAVASLNQEISGYQSNYSQAQSSYEELTNKGNQLVANVDVREDWLKLYQAINAALPRDVGNQQDETDITKRNQIKLWSINTRKVNDLAAWFAQIPAAARNLYMLKQDAANPPAGAGYVVMLKGVHYHHDEKDPTKRGALWVRDTLLHSLKQWSLSNPNVPHPIPVRQLGLTHPVIITSPTREILYDPAARRKQGAGSRPRPSNRFQSPDIDGGGVPNPVIPSLEGSEEESEAPRKIMQTEFEIQLVWQPISLDQQVAMTAIEQVVSQKPDASFQEVHDAVLNTHGIEVSQETYDEFMKKHMPPKPADPAAAG